MPSKPRFAQAVQTQTQGRIIVLYHDRLVSFPLPIPPAILVDIVLVSSGGSTNPF
ncbi:MAG: hypothetical protein M3227_04765 [Thermoproteota archaeon]|nr:hypothetical protein [Thermoproteota archaeon]